METFIHPVIRFLAGHAKAALRKDSSGHGWDHALRVHRNALQIASGYPEANTLVIEAAALMHDVIDRKVAQDPAEALVCVKDWAETAGMSPDDIRHMTHIMQGLSFKGESTVDVMSTLEGKIVQDADRLDAIGAIGIARAFTFGGRHERPLYDPDSPPLRNMNPSEYFSHKSHTINHFHEKLLLLKDRMMTPEGKKMAQDRHAFMELYLNQFLKEWHGL